jgi:hypothetical protein
MGSYVNAGLVRHSLHKQRVARTVPGVWRTARPCPSRFRSPTSTLLVFLGCSMALRDPLNRPMRTRMSGGVAGASGRPLPLCRFRSQTKLTGAFHLTATRLNRVRLCLKRVPLSAMKKADPSAWFLPGYRAVALWRLGLTPASAGQ